MKSLIVFGILVFGMNGFGATLTLSFDDAPRVGGQLYSGNERTERFIKVLNEESVDEVVFYSNPKRKNVPNALDRLRQYSEAGHIIANHTAAHVGLQNATVKDYIESISTADQLIQHFDTYQKWFRFPYLREGRGMPEKGRAVKKYLRENGYQSGYVTIEIYDWHLNTLLQTALKDGEQVDFKKLKNLYFKILFESIDFYENLALNVLGRSPIHVILLHENDLNAFFLPNIIREMRNRGHMIVEAHKAFDDPISDKKWDEHILSQRRLRAIAELSGYEKSVIPKWTDRIAIENAVENEGVFEKASNLITKGRN